MSLDVLAENFLCRGKRTVAAATARQQLITRPFALDLGKPPRIAFLAIMSRQNSYRDLTTCYAYVHSLLLKSQNLFLLTVGLAILTLRLCSFVLFYTHMSCAWPTRFWDFTFTVCAIFVAKAPSRSLQN